MTFRIAARLLCVAALGTVAVGAQQLPPVFRAGIDIVTLDVIVLDKNGHPVKGLTAGDFDVSLDNKKAKVRVADYRDLAVPAGPAAAPAPRPGQTAEPLSGRSILIGVDDFSFPAMEAQPLLADVSAWINTLSPADRVGVMTASGRPTAPFSRDRAPSAAALKDASGHKTMATVGPIAMSIQEAKVIDDNAPHALDLFLQMLPQFPFQIQAAFKRECTIQSEYITCYRAFRNVAQTIAQDNEATRQRSTEAYGQFLNALGATPLPRTLVLVSAGFPVDNSLQIRNVTRAASELGAQVYILTPEPSRGGTGRAEDRNRTSSGIGSKTTAEFRKEDEEYLKAGLDRVANETNGKVFRVVTSANEMLATVSESMSGIYRLGVEPPVDLKSEGLAVKVSVTRGGAVVKATTRLTPSPAGATADVASGAPAAAAPAAAAASTLPVEIGTVILRDDFGQLRTVITAAVRAAAAGPLKVLLGFADESGKVVRAGTVELKADAGQEYRGTFGIPVPAGSYKLRATVTDPSGGSGSAERPVVVRLNSFGRTGASDLMVACVSADRAFPWYIEQLPAGAKSIVASIELYPPVDSPEPLPELRAVLLAPDGKQLFTRPMTIKPTTSKAVASAEIPLKDVPPGRYELRADAQSGANTLGSLSTHVVVPTN